MTTAVGRRSQAASKVKMKPHPLAHQHSFWQKRGRSRESILVERPIKARSKRSSLPAADKRGANRSHFVLKKWSVYKRDGSLFGRRKKEGEGQHQQGEQQVKWVSRHVKGAQPPDDALAAGLMDFAQRFDASAHAIGTLL
jgi:hypothetical protein